jgi:hypothetical protein
MKRREGHTPGRAARPIAMLLAALLAAACSACGRSRDGGGGGDAAREATIEELNGAVEAWFTMRGEWPRSVEELRRFPGLRDRTLPAPPPGKTWAIDPETRKIVAVDG